MTRYNKGEDLELALKKKKEEVLQMIDQNGDYSEIVNLVGEINDLKKKIGISQNEW